MKIADIISESSYILDNIQEDSSYTYTTEKQILTRIRQILYDRKLSGTESNAGELHRLKQQLKDIRNKNKSIDENFADGRGPGRPGDSQRHGILKNATIAQLEKAAKAKGRKGQLARWQLNMRRGRKNAQEDSFINEIFNKPYTLPKRWKVSQGSEQFSKQIVLDDNRIFKIEFEWDPEIRYALVNFYVDDQQDITGKGDSIKIFSTFVSAMKQFISGKKPSIIAFIANDKDSSRIKLYNKLVPWMINNNIASGYSDFSEDLDSLPDDFILWTDDRQNITGKMYALVNNKWLDDRFASDESLYEELSAEQRALAAKLTKLIDHVSLVLMPTVNGGKTFIVNLEQRPIVVVNLNGHTVPFYCSTGRGGKADVAAGQWYPFWGIGSDGWFNKGSGDMINNYYYNTTLKNIAALLNQYLGNLVGVKNIPMAGNSAIAVMNHDQQPMNYAQARSNVEEYFSRIDSQITKIQGY